MHKSQTLIWSVQHDGMQLSVCNKMFMYEFGMKCCWQRIWQPHFSEISHLFSCHLFFCAWNHSVHQHQDHPTECICMRDQCLFWSILENLNIPSHTLVCSTVMGFSFRSKRWFVPPQVIGDELSIDLFAFNSNKLLFNLSPFTNDVWCRSNILLCVCLRIS